MLKRISRLAEIGGVGSIRGLRRSPLYAITFVLTLMLAVGAAATAGAVIKPALFDPLPFRDDGSLVVLNTSTTNGVGPVNIHTLHDLRASAPPLSEITAWRNATASYTTGDGVYSVPVGLVEPNYFSTLGVVPVTGRVWNADETNAVIVSWTFWQQRLNADQAAIGRHLTLNGQDFFVIGVMSRAFVAPGNTAGEIWMRLDPAALLADPYRARRQLQVAARRAPGASLDDVAAHLSVFSARMAAEHTNVPGGQTLVATPIRERILGSSITVIRGVGAATLLLLLIVTANIAGLAAVRAIGLRRQTAVKLALGASHRRVAAERLGESTVLALAGSVAGAALSAVLISTLRTYQPYFLPGLASIDLTPAIAAIAIGLGTIVGAAAGVMPHLTLRARAGEDPLRGSRGSAGDAASARLRMGLTAAQAALALVLIVGAGLLGRTLSHLASTPLGFDPERLSAFAVNLAGSRYASAAAQVQFERTMLERLSAVPGVEEATASIGIPINGGMGAGLYIEGREENGAPIHYMSVAPNFTELLGLRMLSGRALDTSDIIGSERTLVINETMAKKFWPEGDAVGARIFVGVAPSQQWMTVVGIMSDVRQHGAGMEVMPTAFGSSRQYSWPTRHFIFKTAPGRIVAETDLRAALLDIDSTLAVTNLSTLSALVTTQQATRRLVLFVLGTFAVVAVVLCAFGIYAVLALTSSLRRREYAIRVALGSTTARVRWLVVRQAIILTAIGVVGGTLVAWLTTRGLQGLLVGVPPTDPATFAGAAAGIVAVGVIASWLPAQRAAAVDVAEVFADDSGA
jgi:putative ABC transport system permease protein